MAEKKGFFKEFKEFITRGNVLDMAVGVIVATAFGKITTSLVNDVFMPVVGWICGGVDLTKLNIVLKEEVLDEAGAVAEAGVTIGIGTFLGTIIDFILVAFIVFLVIKAFNKAHELAERNKAKEEAAEAAAEPEPAPSKEEVLLTEIRDLLKEKRDV
ncbi:MAG: large-conductance mechanosensitive channel protein MscL [Oscillospiraceae bacterium]